MTGGWLADVGLANEATAGEGGAKRGEYEVRIRGVDHLNPIPCEAGYTCVQNTNGSSTRCCSVTLDRFPSERGKWECLLRTSKDGQKFQR